MNEIDPDIDYIRWCLSFTPAERFLMGIELSEWAMKTNKYTDKLIEKMLEGQYCLR